MEIKKKCKNKVINQMQWKAVGNDAADWMLSGVYYLETLGSMSIHLYICCCESQDFSNPRRSYALNTEK